MSPGTKETKAKTNQWDFIRPKSCTAKETNQKTTTTTTTTKHLLKNIFTNDTCNKGLASKIYKELMKLNNKIIGSKNGQRAWDIPPEKTNVANTHERMLITNHQENANQYELIRLVIIKKSTNNMLRRMWRKGNPCPNFFVPPIYLDFTWNLLSSSNFWSHDSL